MPTRFEQEWLIEASAQLKEQCKQTKNKLEQEWVAKNRKYPNGFIFPYEEYGEAKITGAFCPYMRWNTFELEDLEDLDDIYIMYTCYVPEYCDQIIFPEKEAIGYRPNAGVCIPEIEIDRILSRVNLNE